MLTALARYMMANEMWTAPAPSAPATRATTCTDCGGPLEPGRCYRCVACTDAEWQALEHDKGAVWVGRHRAEQEEG